MYPPTPLPQRRAVTRWGATDVAAGAPHAHTARALSQRGAGVAMGVRSVHVVFTSVAPRVACARAAVVRVAAADNEDKPDTAREAISTGSELYKVGVASGHPTRRQRTMQTVHTRQVVSWG